jgi:hypothetical protein
MISRFETNVRCVVCRATYDGTTTGSQTTIVDNEGPHTATYRVGDGLQLPATMAEVFQRGYFTFGCAPLPPPRASLVVLEPWSCPRGCDRGSLRNAHRVTICNCTITDLRGVAFEASEVKSAVVVSCEFDWARGILPLASRTFAGVDESVISLLSNAALLAAICGGWHELFDDDED